jgi:hypothetical protein
MSGRKKLRTKDPRVVLQVTADNVNQLMPAVDQLAGDVNQLRTGIETLYYYAHIAAFWPWPLNMIVWWWTDRKKKKAYEKAVAAMQAEFIRRQQEVEAETQAPPEEESNIVTMDRTIVGPDGRPT